MKLKRLFSTPLDQLLLSGWNSVDRAYRTAFFLALTASVLAFGFEMTNLTFHHDDVNFIFVQDASMGIGQGRFGFGWVHWFTQDAHIMPFLQMVEALVLMSLYGLVIARLWGLERALDVALVATVMCVFPYMAQMYQYNAVAVPFALAHFFSAAAALLSTRATITRLLAAAVLYAAAFSIYQSVIANAATILVFWFLSKLLFKADSGVPDSTSAIKPALAAVSSLALGGLVYVASVSFMNISLEPYQGADKAFSLNRDIDLSLIASQMNVGARSFFVWPEHYFPGPLKMIQVLFLFGGAIVCLWVPRTPWRKVAAVAVLLIAAFTPRLLQVMHAEGNFHNLTLTAYAVLIAGSLMLICRAAPVVIRNVSTILAFFLVAGYVIQCNWISTVSYLNSAAHFSQATQILARVRSLPDGQWDGRTIVVAGSLHLYDEYPFKRATGVSTDFLDARHLQRLTHLLRDKAKVMPVEEAAPAVRALAASLPAWPHPASVAIVDNVAVVALSAPKGEGSRAR